MPHLEQQIESLFSAAPSAMLLVDDDGRIVMANALAELLLQYRSEELLGQPLEMLIPAGFDHTHVQDRHTDVTNLANLFLPDGREYWAVRKDGREFPVEVGISMFRTKTADFKVASIVDVTDRKQAEHLFHQLFQCAPDGTVVVDRNGQIQMVNTCAEEMFGYTSSELINQPIEILVPAQFRCPHAAQVKQFCAHPTMRAMGAGQQFSARRKDGSEFPVEISLSPVETRNGLMVFSSIRDVTEHRRLLRALASNLNIQQTTADILRMSMASLPLDAILRESLKRLLAVPWLGSEAAGSVFLVDREDRETLVLTTHQGLSESFVTRNRRVAVKHWLRETGAGYPGIVFTADLDDLRVVSDTHMPPSGHYLVPMFTDGRLLGILHIDPPGDHRCRAEQEDFLSAMADLLVGIVKRHLAELAQHDSEERFALAVQGTDAGIWDWDLRTGGVYFSPQWKSMLGYAPDELADDLTEWKMRLHPDDRERALDTVRRYLADELEVYELEHRLRHKDGTYRRILARGAAVFDEHGHAYRMVGSHLDITGLRQAENQVREHQVQFLAAHRIQQRMLPQAVPEVPGWDIAGACFAAEYTAGDYYDLLQLPNDAVGLVIADVRGHGVGPALLMATASAYIRSLAALGLPLTQMVAQTNKMLSQQMEDDQFITLLICRLDPETRTLTHVNAGHPVGYVMDSCGSVKATLGDGGLPLGILSEIEYPEGPPIKLDPGDTILLLTDGLLEARSSKGEFFGTAHVLDLARTHRHRTAAEIIQLLRSEINQITGDDTLVDDVTLVVAKALPTHVD